MTSTPPLHHAQITRALPEWVKMLHPRHTRQVVQQLRADYLAEDGSPHSWYATASDEDRQQLRALIETRNTSREALKKALTGLKGMTEFCKPLLTQRLSLGVSVDKAQYVFQPFEPVTSNWPGVPDPEVPLEPDQAVDILAARPVGAPQPQSLLEAALHNFEGLEEVGAYSQLTCAPDDDSPLQGLSMASFVKHCRELDLGQRYQEHLQAIHEGPRKGEIERLTITVLRDSLRLQAHIASLKGLLSKHGLDGLVQLCDNATRPTYGQQDLLCWRFSLFDIPIHDILLIGPDQVGQSNPCIVYMPDDSEETVREFPSRQEAARHLRRRLLQSDFRQVLINCAYKDKQAKLARSLQEALFEKRDDGVSHPRKQVDLRFAPSALTAELWPALYRSHLSRMKADARTLAVPTADVDAKARQERLAHWLETGLSVLNIAAFFIPGLNAVMTGVFAYQLMGSVFSGFHAWEEGDAAQAVGQLESLAINAAVIAGFAVGARLVQRSGFVDALRSVWHEDRELLWHPEMARYISTTALPKDAEPDALGLYPIDDKTYWVADGDVFEVFQGPDSQWRVRHPSDPEAYAPPLQHHGDGRWLLNHERPAEWGNDQLLRRLGRFSAGLGDTELSVAQRITGTDSAVLRRTLAAGLRPPAMLCDTLLRLRLDNQVENIIVSVRNGQPILAYRNYALPELLALPEWPQDHVLKVYDGPEPWGNAVRYGASPMPGQVEIEITRADLESGKLSEAVLLQIEEQQVQSMLGETPSAQRATTLNNKLADRLNTQRKAIFESLLHGHRQARSPAEQTLAGQFPGLPDSALAEMLRHISRAEQRRLVSGRVPLRIAEEARLLQARTRLDHAILGLYRPSLANGDSRQLAEALLAEHPNATAGQLLEYALADRERCATLLGQQPVRPGFRSPLRLADGRAGYPLSGRGTARNAATLRLWALYPELDYEQIRTLITELNQAGDLGLALNRLEAEQRTLHSTLSGWADATDDRFERNQRRQCAEQLMNAWRREGGSQYAMLELEHLEVGQLPTITARLPHIRVLKLDALNLHRLEGEFLACFPHLEALDVSNNLNINAQSLFEALRSTPRLRTLTLSGNGLTTLSATAQQALDAMPGLRVLNLPRNYLELNEASLDSLARLQLEGLNLANNHITLNPALATRFQDMVHLQVLRLSFNPLQLAPDFSFMARLSHLALIRCDLQEWPTGLTTLMSQPQYQLRHLDLSHNSIQALTDLPGVLRTPYARDVAARLPGRRWQFNYNPLEADTRARLLGSDVAVFSHAAEIPQWQTVWRSQASTAQDTLWNDLFGTEENTHLLGVLERLALSAEARQDAQGINLRVWALLEKAGQDTGLRERLEHVAQQYPPTCGDAGTDAFSALEIEVLTYETAGHSGDRSKTLLSLYYKLFRRDNVNELADRISLKRTLRKQALQDDVPVENLPPCDELDDPAAYPDSELETGLVDDIEVRLALRQSLATRLDFPEPSRGMLYRDTARITPQIIDKVAAEVARLDNENQARQQWLVEQSGWVMHLKNRHADQFTLITDFWRSGHDYLFYCLDEGNEAVTRLDTSVINALAKVLPASPLDEQGILRRVPLNDGQFKQAMDALSTEQQQVEAGLLLSLTRQVETLGS